ncbi:hypothetical protein NFI96_009430, partial [Prochilodus magdalenae]
MATLPRFEPLSAESSELRSEPHMREPLTRWEMDREERAAQRRADMDLKLSVRRMELDMEKEIRLRELELKVKESTSRPRTMSSLPPPSVPRLEPVEPVPLPSTSSGMVEEPRPGFAVAKHIALVPPFREAEVDTYFSIFERIAIALRWPKDYWTLLLQCKTCGKSPG